MSCKKSTKTSVSNESRIYTFYFWDLCRWQKVPGTTSRLLSEAYKTKEDKVMVATGMDQLYQIDFENKLQKNMKTGYIQSLAWECHTTGLRVGFDTPINCEKQEPVPGQDFACIRLIMSPTFDRNFDTYNTANSPKGSSGDSSMCNGTQSASFGLSESKAREFPHKLGKKVACLEPDSTEFSAVKLLFDKGCSRQVQTNVRAVHKVVNSEVKKRAFADQVCEMERSRGDARLQYAWYEATAGEVFSVVMYGFSQSSMSGDAGNAYGYGIHLTPCTQNDRRAKQAAKDSNKEHHLILCEVILGECEVIPPGSQVSLPSSPRFDSGTDSLTRPSTYVVWFPFSNSHIIPWYVVSFTAEEMQQQRPRELRRGNSNHTTPYLLLQVAGRDTKERLFHPSDPRTRSKLLWLNILAGPTTPAGVLPSLASPSTVLQRDLNVLSMLSPSPRGTTRRNRLNNPSIRGSATSLEENDASSVHGPADDSDRTSSSGSLEIPNSSISFMGRCPQEPEEFEFCGEPTSMTLVGQQYMCRSSD